MSIAQIISTNQYVYVVKKLKINSEILLNGKLIKIKSSNLKFLTFNEYYNKLKVNTHLLNIYNNKEYKIISKDDSNFSLCLLSNDKIIIENCSPLGFIIDNNYYIPSINDIVELNISKEYYFKLFNQNFINAFKVVEFCNNFERNNNCIIVDSYNNYLRVNIKNIKPTINKMLIVEKDMSKLLKYGILESDIDKLTMELNKVQISKSNDVIKFIEFLNLDIKYKNYSYDFSLLKYPNLDSNSVVKDLYYKLLEHVLNNYSEDAIEAYFSIISNSFWVTKLSNNDFNLLFDNRLKIKTIQIIISKIYLKLNLEKMKYLFKDNKEYIDDYFKYCKENNVSIPIDIVKEYKKEDYKYLIMNDKYIWNEPDKIISLLNNDPNLYLDNELIKFILTSINSYSGSSYFKLFKDLASKISWTQEYIYILFNGNFTRIKYLFKLSIDRNLNLDFNEPYEFFNRYTIKTENIKQNLALLSSLLNKDIDGL